MHACLKIHYESLSTSNSIYFKLWYLRLCAIWNLIFMLLCTVLQTTVGSTSVQVIKIFKICMGNSLIGQSSEWSQIIKICIIPPLRGIYTKLSDYNVAGKCICCWKFLTQSPTSCWSFLSELFILTERSPLNFLHSKLTLHSRHLALSVCQDSNMPFIMLKPLHMCPLISSIYFSCTVYISE